MVLNECGPNGSFISLSGSKLELLTQTFEFKKKLARLLLVKNFLIRF